MSTKTSGRRGGAWRFFAGLLLLVPSGGRAAPPEYEVNAREACRRAVAGAYLDAYGERERLKDLVRVSTAEIRALKAALASARQELAAADAKLKAQAFDADLASRRDSAAVVVKGEEDQLDQYEHQVADAQAKVGAPTAEEKRLRALIERVFVFERTQDEPDGGYPLRLSYRSPCPKYRALCPLPPKDADRLLEITVDGKAPEACQHYVNLSRIP